MAYFARGMGGNLVRRIPERRVFSEVMKAINARAPFQVGLGREPRLSGNLFVETASRDKFLYVLSTGPDITLAVYEFTAGQWFMENDPMLARGELIYNVREALKEGAHRVAYGELRTLIMSGLTGLLLRRARYDSGYTLVFHSVKGPTQGKSP